MGVKLAVLGALANVRQPSSANAALIPPRQTRCERPRGPERNPLRALDGLSVEGASEGIAPSPLVSATSDRIRPHNWPHNATKARGCLFEECSPKCAVRGHCGPSTLADPLLVGWQLRRNLWQLRTSPTHRPDVGVDAGGAAAGRDGDSKVEPGQRPKAPHPRCDPGLSPGGASKDATLSMRARPPCVLEARRCAPRTSALGELWRLHQSPSARSRSRIRSLGCSKPTDSRTRPSVTPIASRTAGAKRLWVVVAGWGMRLFASPRLFEILTMRSALKSGTRPTCRRRPRSRSASSRLSSGVARDRPGGDPAGRDRSGASRSDGRRARRRRPPRSRSGGRRAGSGSRGPSAAPRR